MAREEKNLFQITAYYSGNTCIIDEKHSFQTCEILCKLFNYNAVDIVSVRDDLKSLLQLLLFKFDNNYKAWNEYDKNVYKAQRRLNFVKDLLLKMPLYKHTVHSEDFDYSDLIHCLSLHGNLFDHEYNDTMSRKDIDRQKEKMREHGVPEETISRIFDDDEDEENYEEGFEDRDEHYSYVEDRRYKKQDYGFYDSHVLEEVHTFADWTTHFRPHWHRGDVKQEDYLGAELLNRDLRNLIEPYIELLDTLVFLEETYGRFLDEYIHSKGRYLTEDEIAVLYEKYISERSSRKIIKPSGTMTLECKTVKLGNKSVWCDVYTFDSLSTFLYFDFFRGLRQGFIPKRCEHCGRFFLLTSGRYYDFCERVVKGTNGKTCRDIGAHKKYEEKCKSDPVWLAYNRAYKAHYARLLKKKMTKSEFLTWSIWAADYRDTALAGKVRIEEYEKKIKE